MSTKPRKPRTETDLRDASSHLTYEIDMLWGSARVHANGSGLLSAEIKNALVESFAVHLRNLLDFLYLENPRPDDVIAEDFFDTPEIWVTNRPAKSQILKAAHTRAHKEVSHLTYNRLSLTPENKVWQQGELLNEIVPVLKRFVELVPRERVDPGLKAKFEN